MFAPRLHPLLAFCVLAAFAHCANAADSDWKPLFNGKDLEGWDTYLHIPQPMWDVPGLKRDENGKYLEPIGANRDPQSVFTVVNIDGQPAVRISGQGFGVLQTKESYRNYHVRLQQKWGEKRWEPRLTVRRDSGLLYHCFGAFAAAGDYWPQSQELQLQEKDFGDLFAIGTQMSVPVRKVENGGKRPQFIYDPKGELTVFQMKTPNSNRAIRMEDREKPHGEWNTVELICLGEDSIHIINGTVVMRLSKSRRLDSGSPEPLTEGKLCLQSECAEVYYRNVEIRQITEIPPEYAEKKP